MPDSSELIEEGRRYEGHGVLDRALESYTRAAEQTTSPSVVAEALTHQSRVHRCRSEWDLALATARRAREIASGAKLDAALVEATIAEGNVLICQGNFPDAVSIFRRLADTSTDARVRGIALKNLGSILWQQGQLGAAERSLAESLGWFQRAGYALGEAMALNDHGRISLERGKTELAKQLLLQARQAARALEDAELIALVAVNYAAALAAEGDNCRASEEAGFALGYFSASGNRWREIECLQLIGTINERLGDRADAMRCNERALTVAEEIGARQEARMIRESLSRLGRSMPRPTDAA